MNFIACTGFIFFVTRCLKCEFLEMLQAGFCHSYGAISPWRAILSEESKLKNFPATGAGSLSIIDTLYR